MSLKQEKKQGFTLIELLVVVVLLGILSGIAVFAVGNARDKAIAESCKSQQAQILKALDLYYIDNKGKWPNAAGTAPGSGASTATNNFSWTYTAMKAALVPTYLKEIPPFRQFPGTDAGFINLGTGDVSYNTNAVAEGRTPLADADVFFTALVVKPVSGPGYIQMRNSLGAANCQYQPAS